MRLYKYLPEQFAISNIKNRRIKVSEFHSLNDPFELMGADLIDIRKRNAVNRMKDKIGLVSGIISFSKVHYEPLLWGHYADNHMGIALGYDVHDEFLIPVKYRSQRFEVIYDQRTRSLKNGKAVVDGLISTKYINWQYEQEVRIYSNLSNRDPSNNICFCPLDEKLVLREVWVGMNNPLSRGVIDKLLEEAGYRKGVFVKKKKMALRKFAMIEDRSF
jgi:Protein of unknown function (DUF2971)